MKTICVLFAGLWLFAFNSSADIIAYGQKITVSTNGAGETAKKTFSGWWLMDAQTGDLVRVNVQPNRGKFHIETVTGHTVETVSGGFNRDYLVIAIPGQGTGSLMCKGLDLSLYIGVPTFYSFPRSLFVTGSDLFTDGDVFLVEYSGFLFFDRNESLFANFHSFTLDEEVDDLRQFLLSLGYEEI